MTPPKDEGGNASGQPHYRGAKNLIELIQLVLAVGGTLGAAYTFFRQTEPLLRWLSLGVVALGAGWYVASRWWRGRRRPKPEVLTTKPGGGALLRGLLPFEQGEQLLGRDNDLRLVLAKIGSAEFRFGSVSGDAGVGKTSFLRAGVVTELAAAGQPVFYVPRLGGDPLRAIAKAIRAGPVRLDNVPADATLRQLLAAARDALPGKRLLVVCDQLDEFFIAHRTQGARRFFVEAVGHCYADDELPVGFLWGLRKEFVGDLQDFAPRVPQPLDVRFSHRLRNWEPDEAAAVLDAAARHDNVPFADALKAAIVRDLERGGEVRPVELQLVATRLNEQRVYDPRKYKEAERARGVLESFVKEVIDPPGAQTPEEERQVARHLLRSLCADNAEAKRPTGLRLEELAARIRATLSSSGQGDLVRSDQALADTLARVLGRCQSAFLVIQEDEQTYNLIHDYIVRAIRDATADIETVEERANRLLDQYLEDERRNARATVPFRHLRFVSRFASPERRLAASRLLRRSRLYLAARTSVITAGALVLLTIIAPPRTDFQAETTEVPDATWILSEDRRVAVSKGKDGKISIWRTDQPWDSRLISDFAFDQVAISPHSNFIAGHTVDDKVYVWRAGERLTGDAKPVLQMKSGQRGNSSPPAPIANSISLPSGWVGFSPDERLVAAISWDTGDLFVWGLGETPGENSAPLFGVSSWSKGLAEPPVFFSPRGKYMAACGPTGETRLWRTDLLVGAQPFDFKIDSRGIGYTNKIRFSNDERWMAFNAGDRSLNVANLEVFPSLKPQRALSLPGNNIAFAVFFSPDNQWIVARQPDGDIYAWPIISPPGNDPEPAIQPERKPGAFISVGVEFSRGGQWVAAVDQYSDLYVWQLSKSTAQIEPVMSRVFNDFKFNPAGDWLVGKDKDGGVHFWRPGQKPDLYKPVARHDGSVTTFAWSNDGVHLFSYGGSDVFFGKAGEQMQHIIRNESKVDGIAVTPGGRELIVFGENHMTTIRRKYYVWGIPVRTVPWPELFTRTQVN